MRANYPPLIFALVGFTLAQPIYDLILSAPEFLVARQNTNTDTWLLVVFLQVALPLILVPGGIFLGKIHIVAERAYFGLLVFILTAVFLAQLAHDVLATQSMAFFFLVGGMALLLSWAIQITAVQKLAWFLAFLSLGFPILFLFQVPDLDYGEGVSFTEVSKNGSGQPLPPVIFIIADELPLSTLIDNTGSIDQNLFPNFHRLQQSSNWYRDTTTIADGTPEAVPAILTGNYPSTANTPATIANAPVNLFTLLQGNYRLNVAEAVTRLCPRAHCPVYSPPGWSRFSALLLDLSALYLHRVFPQNYSYLLPDVSSSWSGFFAEKQQFFPGGWLEFAQGQATVNRPEMFTQFTRSIQTLDQPGLNFIHVLYPHVPFAYLPDGRNYGDHWLRGLEKEEWHDTTWGVLNSKQRHFLQVQHFDKLIGVLLNKLESMDTYKKSLVVVVADHGAAFRIKDRRRALSETNTAEILRVPLFIKAPGQIAAQIFDEPVMTIDILPTLLSMLGIEHGTHSFDGIDLTKQLPLDDRERQALSFKHRQYQSFAGHQLDLTPVTAQNRSELALDDAARALWAIGPFAEYHGDSLEQLCTPANSNIRSVPGQNNPLPGAEDEVLIPAFVTGRFDGELPEDKPYPFVITVNNIIVASGETWQLRGSQLYFAMVEPIIVNTSNFNPQAWIYTPDACLGGSADSP